MSYRLRAVSAGAFLALCATRPVHAQSERSGRIEGSVSDSVHARPLADAHVVAIGTGAQSEVRREATTDSTGRYHIDSLPTGRYVVGFESALLDSLEVTLSPREANLTAGQDATLDLALPSAKKLRSAVCLGATLPPDAGVILGHVVNAETDSPLAGVTIAMAWRDLGVDRKTLRPINRQRSDSVVTDRDGWYRMCGVATGAWVSVQARQGTHAGAVLRTRVDDTLGIAVVHLSLSTGETTAAGPAGAPLSGTATLTGVVRSTAGVPVASAEVRVRDTGAETRTGAQGEFTLRGLPAGTQQLEVRHIGYAVVEVPVALRSGATTTHDVALRRIVNLDSMVIVASRPKYPDFYAHQTGGMGHFLGPELIAKQRVARTSDFFEKIPGFGVLANGSRTLVVGTQGTGGLRGECVATVVIDGVRVLEYPPNVNDIHWSDVAAIEAYPASMAPTAPPEYRVSGFCGGIVIWTKR